MAAIPAVTAFDSGSLLPFNVTPKISPLVPVYVHSPPFAVKENILVKNLFILTFPICVTFNAFSTNFNVDSEKLTLLSPFSCFINPS